MVLVNDASCGLTNVFAPRVYIPRVKCVFGIAGMTSLGSDGARGDGTDELQSGLQ